jgi:uncharacterized membrane protein YkvA (DUF1232 family)
MISKEIHGTLMPKLYRNTIFIPQVLRRTLSWVSHSVFALDLNAPKSETSIMSRIAQVKDWARRVKRDVVAVYFAARDPRTPLVARCIALAVAAYALSPIDLIPDFIPVLGYLDDLLIVPLGLLLVIRLLPPLVLVESREKANALLSRPRSYVAAAFMVCVWLLCIIGFAYWWYNE